ncbi:MAG: hypothetical protein IKO52_16150 [Clostridia bacterium]|nr:hypothetical protein [Clostridia bacterium]
MKKVLCIMVCLCLLIPCALAEELPQVIEENGADYSWLYENALTVAERFQYGLDCTWHSFLLSAANVPEREMVDALSPLRTQDYNQPTGVTIVRADQLVPDEMIEAWQAALKAEEEAKAARAALRAAELVNELAIVKLANAEQEAVKQTEEAARIAGDTYFAAEESALMAREAAEAALKSGDEEAAKAAEESAQTAEEIAKLAEEAFKAAEEAAKAVKELDKGEAFLAAKEAKKAAEKTDKAVKDAKKAAEEAAKAAQEAAEAEETPDAKATEKPVEKKQKTPVELAAQEAALRIEDTVIAAEKAAKAAEESFKAEANAIQAAQTLADLKEGKTGSDAGDDFDLEFEDGLDFDDELDFEDDFGFELDGDTDDLAIFDFDFDADTDGAAGGSSDSDWEDWDDWDLDWDDWDLEWDDGASTAGTQEKNRDEWFIEDDPDRDLYHSAAAILNFHEENKMFSAISKAIRVTGIYTRDDALDGPCYAVIDYDGEYALLITWYPAGDGYISESCQIIYSRSADHLFMPAE